MALVMKLAEPLNHRAHPDAALTPLVKGVVHALPSVRPEAVGRARLLLATAEWCRADEVADRLVDCYLTRRVP